MLMIENMAALAAFAFCLLAFIAGYALRQHVDTAREEWAAFTSYRPTSRRARYGRR